MILIAGEEWMKTCFQKSVGMVKQLFSLNFIEIPLWYAEKGKGKQSRGRRNRKELAYKIPIRSMNHRLQNLPIFRNDGSLDFGSLGGMPVSIDIIQSGNRVFVKKIAYDVSYYRIESGD